MHIKSLWFYVCSGNKEVHSWWCKSLVALQPIKGSLYLLLLHFGLLALTLWKPQGMWEREINTFFFHLVHKPEWYRIYLLGYALQVSLYTDLYFYLKFFREFIMFAGLTKLHNMFGTTQSKAIWHRFSAIFIWWTYIGAKFLVQFDQTK